MSRLFRVDIPFTLYGERFNVGDHIEVTDDLSEGDLNLVRVCLTEVGESNDDAGVEPADSSISEVGDLVEEAGDDQLDEAGYE